MGAQQPRALLSWSSGKDSAWTLHEVRRAGRFELQGLVTTLDGDAGRVAMHGVRRELVVRQAELTGLPLYEIGLPAPCSNEVYEARLGEVLAGLREALDITHMIFGDLFLADIRAYRERQMAALGLEAVFPLWRRPTRELAGEMIDGGLEAWVSCVDTEQLDARFCGRRFDTSFLAELPEDVDPCGENGEFHSLATAGPMFAGSIRVARGQRREEPRFVFMDFLPA